ncbi:putative AC transposase [Morella rubra]|uniref:Putative AC transposase n=1 Tax=Morella rubra TaxID=262757 RepID=A0A6A1W5Q8_9ROSI|nr:putative AC transposase [Morella rubra]
MLNVAEKYQRTFELLQEDDEHIYNYLNENGPGRRGLGAPNDDDWEKVRTFVRFLQIFYDVTMCLSGSMYATSNLHFQEVSYIHTHLMAYCDSHDDLLSAMAFRMKLKYEKYWGDVEKINRLLFVAVILDPRYKIITLEFWFEKVMGVEEGEKFIEMLKVDVERLYRHYNDGLSSVDSRMGSETSYDYEYDSQSSDSTMGRGGGVRIRCVSCKNSINLEHLGIC